MKRLTGKNHKAWEEIFAKHDILRHIENFGSFRISAQQIREYREPRLMAKFDHKNSLPEIFLENELAILPVTRGEYVIAHFDAYHKLENFGGQIIKAKPPENIQSLNYDDIQNEATALNCAFAAGITADFLEDDSMIATVYGRMGTGLFDFNIADVKTDEQRLVKVENAQIEIDASYEGRSSMAIFEAKLDLADDFITRQLYYPFRVWREKITKPVRLVFFLYSNKIFRLYEYAFEDVDNYSSIRLVKQKNYSVEDTSITAKDIQDILSRVAIIPEPKVPFPQADSFERVINLCEHLSEHSMSSYDVTEQYAFTSRQASYYTNAARYLGLLESQGSLHTLSKTGRQILKMNYRNRQLSFCRLILSHGTFNEVLKLCFDRGYMPDNEEIKGVMERSNLYNVSSGETFVRRVSTVRKWLEWIIGLITE